MNQLWTVGCCLILEARFGREDSQKPSPEALEVLEVLESVGEMLALGMICGKLLMDEAS